MSDDFALTPPPDSLPSRPSHRHGTHGNPLLRVYGTGPEGATCGGCRRFVRKSYSGTYFKCRLFGNTNGPGTDWRFRWPACGKYEEAKP